LGAEIKTRTRIGRKNLEVGKIYKFSKKEYRVYPVGLPIDLLNRNWEAVAKVVIIEFKNTDGRTEGKYKVVKIYEGKEKEVLTNYWRENVKLIKQEEITDFSDVKVS